ncbi:hypothetical protein [Actinokineospora terrae]|uniref:Ribosomal protein L9, N-terminal domain n=1 Tax=Actinokineospora terrae TaxID=155974 RepID=A0A1H9M926_9PSEU|nr:hypothetical protein [Actinokineospora terrae]SER20270.1 Ribosomal protein L9, N-terminal domain [Actinokineospora terrae]
MRVRLYQDVPSVAAAGDVVEVPNDARGYGLLDRHLAVQLTPFTPVTVELDEDQVTTLLASTGP